MDQPSGDDPVGAGFAAEPERLGDQSRLRVRGLIRRLVPWDVACVAIIAVSQLTPGLNRTARWVVWGVALIPLLVGWQRYKSEAEKRGIKPWNRHLVFTQLGFGAVILAIGFLSALTVQKPALRPAAVGDCFFIGADRHLYRVPCEDSRATLTGTRRVGDSIACPADSVEELPIQGDSPYVLCLAAYN
jgi:hypothetical protein